MIKNGNITYPGADSLLQNWRPSNVTLYEILLAILTTVLVYQVTSIVFDIFLRSKTQGEVKISDIGTFIAAEDASLRSISYNLGCKWGLARWRYHGAGGKCPLEGQFESSSHFRASSKFVFLLLIVPLINIGGVVLNLENDVRLTFRDVNFGGIAVDVDYNVKTPSLHTGCRKTNTTFGPNDDAIGEFRTCYFSLHSNATNAGRDPSISNLKTHDPLTSRIIVATSAGGSVAAQLWTPMEKHLMTKVFELGSEGEPFLLKQHLDSSKGKRLLERGVQTLFKYCPSNSSKEVGPSKEDVPSTSQRPWDQWWISADLSCVQVTAPMVMEVFAAILGAVTVVDDEKFELLSLTPNGRVKDIYDTVPGSDLNFIRRKRSPISFLVLCICTAVAVVLRISLRLFVRNEVHLGIEASLKDAFGVNCCDSMLQCTREVRYSEITFGEMAGQNESKRDEESGETSSEGRESAEDSYELSNIKL